MLILIEPLLSAAPSLPDESYLTQRLKSAALPADLSRMLPQRQQLPLLD